MKWYYKFLIGVLIVSIIVGLAYREQLIRKYPKDVRDYQKIMKKISSQDYIDKLNNYANFDGNYSELLSWLGERLTYTEDQIIRHEDPIEILEYGKGRCGEFAIAYTALCLASGWKARVIMDISPESEENGFWTPNNPDAIKDGDHVWTEIKLQGNWTHIDPTEQRINEPYMYERDWKKIVTNVWGIEPHLAERIEENYQWIS